MEREQKDARGQTPTREHHEQDQCGQAMCAVETPVQAAHRAVSDLQHHLEVADVELREATTILRQFLE